MDSEFRNFDSKTLRRPTNPGHDHDADLLLPHRFGIVVVDVVAAAVVVVKVAHIW